MTGPGTLLFIDVEAIGPGDARLSLDNGAMHLAATDAQSVTVRALPVSATVK
jgi:hypothetical protein